MRHRRDYIGTGLPCTTPGCEQGSVRACDGVVHHEAWSYEVTYGIRGPLTPARECGAPLCIDCLRRSKPAGGCWLCAEPCGWVECERCGRPDAEEMCAGCERVLCSWCSLPPTEGYCNRQCQKKHRQRIHQPSLFIQMPPRT